MVKTHKKVLHGLCPVCHHHGDDCTGAENKREPMRRNYSVLLLYPDYLDDMGIRETYFTHVKSASPDDAVEAAQVNAFLANKKSAHEPEDFAPLAVFRGHLEMEPCRG